LRVVAGAVTARKIKKAVATDKLINNKITHIIKNGKKILQTIVNY